MVCTEVINEIRSDNWNVILLLTLIQSIPWDVNEPNGNRTENCVMMASSNGRWRDAPCYYEMAYVCKKVKGKLLREEVLLYSKFISYIFSSKIADFVEHGWF